jgi:hypothetical protein
LYPANVDWRPEWQNSLQLIRIKLHPSLLVSTWFCEGVLHGNELSQHVQHHGLFKPNGGGESRRDE